MRRFLSSYLSTLAVLASILAISTVARANEFDGAVKAVPNPNAQPVVIHQVDDTKLVELNAFEVPGGAKDLGPMDANKVLMLELRLRRPMNLQMAVNELNRKVQDPTDAFYNKTLTPEEFARSYGLSNSDLNAICLWLKGHDLDYGNVDNGRLTISFTGTVAQIETAFHTEMHNYAAKDGSQHFAPASALQIPRALYGVINSVSGAENFLPFQAASFNAPVKDFAPGLASEMSLKQTTGASTPSLNGELLHDTSFTSSSYALGIGGHATLNVRLGGSNHPATGSLTLEDNITGATLAHIGDITTCPGYNGNYGRSCSIDYASKTPGTAYLKAIYSGDENNRGAVIHANPLSISGAGVVNISETGVTAAPLLNLYSTAPGQTSATLTIVLAYVGNSTNSPAAAPTGNITVVYSTSTSTIWGTATLGGSGTGTSTKGNAFSYSCAAANTATQTVTCTITMANAYADAVSEGVYAGIDLQATYGGDTHYASAIGAGYVFNQNRAGSQVGAYAATASGSSTYGTAGSVVETVSSSIPYITSSPCGSSSGYAQTDTHSITGTGAVATPYEVGNLIYTMTTCPYSISGSNYVWNGTVTLTTPAWLAPGAYTLAGSYSGNTGGHSVSLVDEPVASTGAATTTVAKYSPAFTASASPSTVAVGTSTAVTLSGTMTIPAIGVFPSGALNYVVNSANYAATCSYSGTAGTLNCTATIPAATVGALDGGTYPITASFAGDNFYNAVTSTGGNFVVTKVTTTTAVTGVSPSSETQGSLSPATVTATLTYSGALAKPTGTPTFTSNAGGTFGATSCGTPSGDVITCTAVFTPTSTDTAGSYYIEATYAGDGIYNGSNSGTANNFTIIAAPTNVITFTVVTHNFGSVAVGTSTTGASNFAVKLTNNGMKAFAYGGVALTGSNEFSYQTNCPASIAAGANCELLFIFSPTAPGAVSATWSVNTSSTGFVYSPSNGGTLSGTGVSAGAVTLTTAGHNFGTQTVGTTSAAYGTELSNSTGSVETITLGPVPSGPFTLITNCGTTLAAASSCEIEFTFTPTTTSPVSIVVPLSGTPTAITAGGAALPSGGITLSGN